MKLPFINTILTLRDSGGNKSVPQMDANGRIQVNTGSSIAPTVSATPPVGPTTGDLWYNTAANQNLLYAFDGTDWLSTSEFALSWGEDSMDGNQAAWAGIGGAGGGTNLQFPRNARLTALTAQIRAGNNAKQFFLQIGGVTQQTITFPGANQVVAFPNLDVTTGQEFWIAGNGAGGNVLDITIATWWKWVV